MNKTLAFHWCALSWIYIHCKVPYFTIVCSHVGLTIHKPKLDETIMQVLWSTCFSTSLDLSFLQIADLWSFWTHAISKDKCSSPWTFTLIISLYPPPRIILLVVLEYFLTWGSHYASNAWIFAARGITTSLVLGVENHYQAIACGWKLHFELCSSSKIQNMWDFNPRLIGIHPLCIEWVFQLSFEFHWLVILLACFK